MMKRHTVELHTGEHGAAKTFDREGAVQILSGLFHDEAAHVISKQSRLCRDQADSHEQQDRQYGDPEIAGQPSHDRHEIGTDP